MTEHKTFRAGIVQMRSGTDVTANLKAASDLIREAAAKGAQYVQTPENTLIMELSRKRMMSDEVNAELNNAYAALGELAAELEIWLHIGASAIRRDDGMMSNRSQLIGPNGHIATIYDKIHMFDADLENGEQYRESNTYHPGDEAVSFSLPWGRLGLTICYDLRFPALFRALAQKGADFIAVPAAFTQHTGEAHWHILLRARAIETGCYILAAGQGGLHDVGRSTFGHSLVVSPWGEVIAEAHGVETCVILADIDSGQVQTARTNIPSLSHDRPFCVGTKKN